MKTPHQITLNLRHEPFSMMIFLALFLIALFGSGKLFAQEDQTGQLISNEQQQRLDLMKAKGIDASVTIFPVGINGFPGDDIAIIIGVLLEEKGLKCIELSKTKFSPSSQSNLLTLADSLGKFVKAHPIPTEYALYSEMILDMQKRAFTELREIVVDKTGAIVWTEKLDSTDVAFRHVADPDPMGFSILLSERLGMRLGLTAETATNAKPGKLSAIFRERFGMPTEKETAEMPKLQKIMKANFKKSKLMVYPLRINGELNRQGAAQLIKMINDAGLCKAIPSKDTLSLKLRAREQNEMKILWNMAVEFRDHIKANPQNADYLLFADYVFNPQAWKQGYVHFVVCDRNGEWVIADLQNSGQAEFQNVMPVSIEGCNDLLYAHLEHYLKASVAEAIREEIHNSGIEAANAKFKQLRVKRTEYYLSEAEMNALGYEYLSSKKNEEAIAVFKMNVEAFPMSFNAYDSLGEAYATAGEKELAIRNYEKSLELNPNSQSGIEALKKLKMK